MFINFSYILGYSKQIYKRAGLDFVNIAWGKANDIINNALTQDKNTPIPDDYVGSFDYVDSFTYNTNTSNESSLWFHENDRKNNEKELGKKAEPNEYNIVIVLESPHKNEYNTDFRHPAIGPTGNNLKLYFYSLLGKLNGTIKNSTKCHVYLMNAIQYQCSLGYHTSIFRTEIFNSMWKHHKKDEDFLDRLKDFYPNIIINLCTKTDELQDIVQKKIDEFVNNNNNKTISLYRGTHPSSWKLKSPNRYIVDTKGNSYNF